jgi:hypothetical protein
MTNKPLTHTTPTRTVKEAGPTPDMIELLGWIAKVGNRADERELAYQLRKHDHPAGDTLLEALADLEARGLVTIFLSAELTKPGWQAVRDGGVDLTDETSFRPWPAPALEEKARRRREEANGG